MQIFPSLSSASTSNGYADLSFDSSFLSSPGRGFDDVFGAFMRDSGRQDRDFSSDYSGRDLARDDLSAQRFEPEPVRHAPLHSHPEPRQDHEPIHAGSEDQPRTDDPLPQDLDEQVSREDFAQLREKLDELGVDEETLDRIENLFEESDTVTWGQVLDILREPLQELRDISLTPEQEQDLISLFNKLGFEPDDAVGLVNDLLDKNFDAVWKKVQEMLNSMAEDETLSIKPQEILALMHALGLIRGSESASGSGGGDTGAEAKNGQLPDQTMAALRQALNKAGETNPDMLKLAQSIESQGLTPDNLQKITDAAAKGELKLDAQTLDALRELAKNAGPAAKSLEQMVQQMNQKELTPEELRTLLSTIRDAADNGANAPRFSMAEGLNALKMTNPDGNQNAAGQNNGQGNMNQNSGQNPSAQGWEAFWNKVGVQSDGAATLGKDAGLDPRSMMGQASAANSTEAAASRIISNAPAPHRAVLNQVHSGLLQNLGQGRQQLTLQLHPAELGSLTVNLKVVGNEVQAMLRAENQEARQIVAENLPLLRQSLEAQGLRVTKLEVQTQLQDQNQFTQLWQGSDGQKFQEQAGTTQWGALGRGQFKNGNSGLEAEEEASSLHNTIREGRINLVA